MATANDDNSIGAYTLALVRRVGSDRGAAEELVDRVYDRLRRRAGRMIARDRAGQDMGKTDLTHRSIEIVLSIRPQTWATPAQFSAAFARTMRRVLIDHARRRIRDERGRNPHPDPGRPSDPVEAVSNLDVSKLFGTADPQLTLDVSEAFCKLRRADRDAHAVAFQIVYGCRTAAEVAAELGVSARTVERRWTVAKLRLGEFLADMGYGPAGAAA